nr:NepR family anti-sigma factor [Methylobacterium planeticum]
MTRAFDDRHEIGPGEPRPASPPQPRTRLDPAARRRIGQCLRVLYADVLAQPLPARFETLLADLAARQIIEESS